MFETLKNFHRFHIDPHASIFNNNYNQQDKYITAKYDMI